MKILHRICSRYAETFEENRQKSSMKKLNNTTSSEWQAKTSNQHHRYNRRLTGIEGVEWAEKEWAWPNTGRELEISQRFIKVRGGVGRLGVMGNVRGATVHIWAQAEHAHAWPWELGQALLGKAWLWSRRAPPLNFLRKNIPKYPREGQDHANSVEVVLTDVTH